MSITEYTKCRKAEKSGKPWSSKSRVRTESHSWFHFLERMLVAADCLVGRNERM